MGAEASGRRTAAAAPGLIEVPLNRAVAHTALPSAASNVTQVYFFGWTGPRKRFGSSGSVNATTVSDAVIATYCLPFFAS